METDKPTTKRVLTIQDFIAVVPFWKRPEVTEIFIAAAKDIGLRYIAVCSIGDEKSFEMLRPNAEWTCMINSNVAGEKWNVGVSHLVDIEDWEYMMILGSDDIVSNRYFDDFLLQLRPDELYAGMLDALAVDIRTKKTRYWPGYDNHREGEMIGPGRVIHKSVIESLDYEPFAGVSKGSIDSSVNTNVMSVIQTRNVIKCKTGFEPYRIGLKSGNEITTHLAGSSWHDTDVKKLREFYSSEIVDMIMLHC